MANYETLKSAIQQVVKTNGNNEITGALLQQSLLAMINSLGSGYQFVGVATPTTNPGIVDQRIFYIANGKGIYANFDGISISEDEVVILYYDTKWNKITTGIASQQSLMELNGIKETIKIGVTPIVNLINPDNWQVGYVNQNGFLDTSTTYRYQEIDIKDFETGTVFTCITNSNASAPARFYCFKDDTMGQGQKISGGQSIATFTKPSGATKLYISFSYAYISDKGLGMFADTDPTWKPFAPSVTYPYGEWSSVEDENAIARIKDINVLVSSNPLYGKKWAVCGDSFTAGSESGLILDGIYAGRPKVYPYLIGNRTGINVLSTFFQSGRTLAYPSDGTFINSLTAPNQSWNYQNIPEDVDYITIMLGINDAQHTGNGSTTDGEAATGVITLGTIDDTTISTYYGAWNTVISWLKENRPFAHIGIIVTNGIQQNGDYHTAQIAIANKYGIPYIDLNGDQHTPAMIRCYNQNIPQSIKDILLKKQAVDWDGSRTGTINWHPNDATHEYESTIIESWLKSL